MTDVPIELNLEADAYRATLLDRADMHSGGAPLWFGWAIFDAYVAGVRAQAERDAKIAEGSADSWGEFPGGTLDRDRIASAIRSSVKPLGDVE